MIVLLEYDYPGNVRELENIIEHAFVLCRGGLIEQSHLPSWLSSINASTREHLGTMTLSQLDKLAITDAIRRNDGNRQAAADELGIHVSTLFRKIKTLQIELPDHDGRS